MRASTEGLHWTETKKLLSCKPETLLRHSATSLFFIAHTLYIYTCASFLKTYLPACLMCSSLWYLEALQKFTKPATSKSNLLHFFPLLPPISEYLARGLSLFCFLQWFFSSPSSFCPISFHEVLVMGKSYSWEMGLTMSPEGGKIKGYSNLL